MCSINLWTMVKMACLAKQTPAQFSTFYTNDKYEDKKTMVFVTMVFLLSIVILVKTRVEICNQKGINYMLLHTLLHRRLNAI